MLVQVWASQRDKDVLERAQERNHEDGQRSGASAYENKLRAGTVQSGGDKAQGGSSQCI